MTIADVWHMESAVMGAYEAVEHIGDPDVQCKAFEMAVRWRELQVDLLKTMADNRNARVGDLAIIASDLPLTEDEEILAKVAWANAEQGMIELQTLVPSVKDAQRIERFMNGGMG